MEEFISNLESVFKENINLKVAQGQKSYLKNQFEFLGISAPRRREIQKPFLIKKFLPPKMEAIQIVKLLWNRPEREYQYFAQELLEKYVKEFEVADLDVLEFMILNKSWWDTVDHIAVKLAGEYFKKFPDMKIVLLKKWLVSDDFWLQRSVLLFQLNYKQNLDKDLLTKAIQKLSNSKEFFIRKAIGWILRQYSKTDPKWVIDFVNSHLISPLSKKEALKLIN